ncbi:MAG: helix-turn-helix domain-containing protein [Lachnospirales bacterium]
MMYKLLVVEDDYTIRNGIISIIKNMNLSIDEIAEAQNGQEAIAIYEDFYPHIVITDIRMPILDGLSFIKWVHENINEKHHSFFIILSGFNDFTYAKEAIYYGVSEYLLKPIDSKDLNKSLVNLIEKINEKINIENNNLSLYTTIEELRKNVLLDILIGHNNKLDLTRKINLLKEIFLEGNYTVIVSYNVNALEFNNSLGFYSLFQMKSLFGYEYTLLYSKKIIKYDFLEALNLLTGYLAYGNADSIDNISNVAKKCRSLVDKRVLFPDINRIQVYDKRSEVNIPNTPIRIPTYDINRAIEEDNYDKIEKIIRNYFHKLMNSKSYTSEFLIETAKIFETSVLAYTLNQMMFYKNQLNQLRSIEFLLSSSKDIEDFIDAIVSRIITICRNIYPYEMITPVDQVIQYINLYYAKDINLVYAANLANMNTNYFSSIFKKQTGKSFISYLQNIRIQNSKKLLLDNTLKIQEIAYTVGYKDEKYFMKVFKSIVGVTPSNFRENKF